MERAADGGRLRCEAEGREGRRVSGRERRRERSSAGAGRAQGRRQAVWDAILQGEDLYASGIRNGGGRCRRRQGTVLQRSFGRAAPAGGAFGGSIRPAASPRHIAFVVRVRSQARRDTDRTRFQDRSAYRVPIAPA